MPILVLPLNILIQRIVMIAGAVRKAHRALSTAHEAPAMSDPAQPASRRRPRELGILK